MDEKTSKDRSGNKKNAAPLRDSTPQPIRDVEIDKEALKEKLIDDEHWGEAEEDEHVRNLYKAEKLLADVVYRQNMYMMASEHYAYLNTTAFTVPSIIVTSISSFLAFAGATEPERAKDIGLTVGFLGTAATILTALQSAYKYDTKAEMFRSAAAEYRLLTTKISAIMRKERVAAMSWLELWEEVEVRMTELQKKMTYFPNRDLVDSWARQGKLSVKVMSSSMMPPWLVRYLQNLEDDGVQAEDDIAYISDDLLDQWELQAYRPNPEDPKKNVFVPDFGTCADRESLTSRYPKVVIEKLRAMRQFIEEQAEAKKKVGPTALKLTMKATTQAALRKRGVVWAHDLRLASDAMLDGVVEELVLNDTPPMPIAWTTLEEIVQEVKLYGCPCPCMRSFYNPALSKQAQARCDKVVDANNALVEASAEAKREIRLASRSTTSPPSSPRSSQPISDRFSPAKNR